MDAPILEASEIFTWRKHKQKDSMSMATQFWHTIFF